MQIVKTLNLLIKEADLSLKWATSPHGQEYQKFFSGSKKLNNANLKTFHSTDALGFPDIKFIILKLHITIEQ